MNPRNGLTPYVAPRAVKPEPKEKDEGLPLVATGEQWWSSVLLLACVIGAFVLVAVRGCGSGVQ